MSLMQNQYCHFFDDDEFEETDRPGFRRRVIAGDHLQLWFWRIEGGAQGSFLHHHDDDEQLGIIMRGKLDLRIGDKDDETRVVLGPGDLYLAPMGVWHGDSVFIGDDELRRGVDPRRVLAGPHRTSTRWRRHVTDRDLQRTATGGSPSTSAARSPTSCCSTRRRGRVVVDKTLTTPSRTARRRPHRASASCCRRRVCGRPTSRHRSCTRRR